MARIIWDQEKCPGCRVCEAICSFTKEGEFNPEKARCRIVRTVEDQRLHRVRVSCLQCDEPACMSVCPAGAISQKEDGVKVVDEDKCLGCKMCELACPVGAITVNPEKHVSIKCDQCRDLDEPQCVKYCWSEALQYIPEERVGAVLARRKSEKFKELNAKEL